LYDANIFSLRRNYPRRKVALLRKGATMHNTLQAANNAEPLQLIGQAITDDLRRFIAEEIAVALNRRPTEILDRRQVAELLKISLPTLLKRTQDGVIPCTRIGRRVLFERAQIHALLQSNGGAL